MSRAHTKEEAREMVLKQIRGLVKYWDTIDERSSAEKLDGLAFSILNIFDGTSISFPYMDIILRPHEDDKEFCEDRGENYFEDGMAINDDVLLHEYFYRKEET